MTGHVKRRNHPASPGNMFINRLSLYCATKQDIERILGIHKKNRFKQTHIFFEIDVALIKVPLDGLQREVMPFFFDSQTNIRDTLRHSIQPKEIP